MNISNIREIVNTYLDIIKAKWKVILIITLIGGVLVGLYGITQKPLFIAKVIFHPEKGKKQSISLDPVAALLGSTFQGSGTDEMIGVLRSRTLSERISSDTLEFEGEDWLIADLILENTPKKFSFTRMLGIRKPKPLSYEKRIYSVGLKLRSRINVQTNDYGFLEFTYSDYNHDLTGEICNRYIETLLRYYKKQKIEKAMRNKEYFQFQSDSVKVELDKVSYSIAKFYDSNKYRTTLSSEVKPRMLEAKAKWLTQIYTQLLLQLEQARTTIQQETPVVQILDPADPPFRKIGTTQSKFIMIGMLLGVFFGFVYVARKKLKQDLVDLINFSLAGPED